VRISLRGFGRRRTVVSVAGSVAAHLLVLAALVWVKPPSTVMTVKRGEPLFVELPEADAQAQRGRPAAPAAKPPKAPAAPEPPPPPPAKPAPPVVAKAAPTPKEVTPPTTPTEAPAPALPPPPPVAQAPTPAEAPTEAPRDTPVVAAPKVAAVPPAPREAVPDIRSLARGRGPDGAGGSGEGWAGIEGDPVPLDTKDKRYSDYLLRVRRMITAKWIYPCVKNAATSECEYKSAKLVIVFGILKDGRVPRVDVAERSSYEIYDDVAVTAIKLASPFPPVPAELMATVPPGSAGIRIVASFHYVLESSLTNILR
jgi:TonB family protein